MRRRRYRLLTGGNPCPISNGQAATLAARHAGLWIAGAQVFVGVLQCAVVAWGIRAMVHANDERAVSAAEDRREAREASAARAAAEDRREARAAAEAERARREADQRHAEAMAAIATQNRHVDTQSAALAEAVAALKVVVERTTPEAAQ